MSPSDHARLVKAARLASFLAPAALPLLVFAAHAKGLRPGLNWDVAMNLLTGEKLLAGKVLYVDWIDNNPPAAYLLSAGIAWLASSPTAQLALYVTLVAALGWAGLATIASAMRDRPAALTAATLASVAALTLGAGLDAEHLGQRDHLVAIAFLVVAALRLFTVAPRALTAWAFVLGVTIAQKPHALALVGALEGAAWLLGRRMEGRLMAATAAVLALGVLAPFALFVALQPEAAGAMVDKAFAHHLSPAGRAYGVGFGWPTQLGRTLAAMQTCSGWLPVMVLGAAATRLISPRTLLAAALVLGGATIVLLLPGKFWPYHFYPVAAAAFASALLATSQIAKPAAAAAAAAVVILTCGVLATTRVLDLASLSLGDTPRVPPAVAAKVAAAERPAVVSTAALDDLPFFFAGKEPAGPLAYHLDFPAVTRLSAARREAALEAYAAREMRAVLASDPDLILFSPRNQALLGLESGTYSGILRALAPHLDLRAYEPSAIEGQGLWVAYERKRAP